MKHCTLLLSVLVLLAGCQQEPQEPVDQQTEAETIPDVRNVRWQMTMDEVKAAESALWTKEPNIIEKNKDGGATIIANVEVFGGNKAMVIYKFEREPDDTLRVLLSSIEYKIHSLSDTEYRTLVLDLDSRHGKGEAAGNAILWETKDRRTHIAAIRHDVIKALTIEYFSYITIWRNVIEEEQKMRRDF